MSRTGWARKRPPSVCPVCAAAAMHARQTGAVGYVACRACIAESERDDRKFDEALAAWRAARERGTK